MSSLETNTIAPPQPTSESGDDVWVHNLRLLWSRRRFLMRLMACALVVSLAVALLMPNQYESTTHLMPPQQPGGGAAMLAALAGKGSGTGSLAGLAGGLLGARGNGAMFLAFLRSGTIAGHIITRFQLQHVYRKRYLQDTAKKLAQKTTVTEDTKSGVITIAVEDSDRQRARDMTQAYIDELNTLIAVVNTSSARREREFIELRLQTVQRDLQQAQEEMSAFASKNTAIDIREQTKAMVDAGAKLQGQLIAGQSELESLEQIYGSENVRVRAAQAKVATLRRELGRSSSGDATDDAHPYPSLRQLPGLGVPWANLYRRVRIQETIFEMLSAQYETSRIEEARSIPTVGVIDPPGLPEKKSSPHRLIIVALSCLFSLVAGSAYLVAERSWNTMAESDTRKLFAREVASHAIGTLTRRRSVS